MSLSYAFHHRRLRHTCCMNIQYGLPFWYWLTKVDNIQPVFNHNDSYAVASWTR